MLNINSKNKKTKDVKQKTNLPSPGPNRETDKSLQEDFSQYVT